MEHAYRQAQRHERPFCSKAQLSYLSAWKLSGGSLAPMVSTKAMAEHLRDSGKERPIGPIWTRHVAIYPEEGREFRKCRDFCDSWSGWVMPGKYIPDEALGRSVILIAEPGSFEESWSRLIMHPKKITLIDEYFRLRAATVIIPGGDDRVDAPLRLFRLRGPGVRPIAANIYGDQGKNLSADYSPEAQFLIYLSETF